MKNLININNFFLFKYIIFSNSLFKEFTSNANELKDSHIDIINLNINNNTRVENLNNLVSKNPSPFDTNNNIYQISINNKNTHNNKKGKIQNNT